MTRVCLLAKANFGLDFTNRIRNYSHFRYIYRYGLKWVIIRVALLSTRCP